MMRLFTFVVERGGGTYCSQHCGAVYEDAARQFCKYAVNSEYLNSAAPTEGKLTKSMLEAVALKDLSCVRYASHLDDDDVFWGINIIETVNKQPEGEQL